MVSGVEIYLATGAILLLSLLLGGALCIGPDRRWTWLAPGIGFAAVMCIAWLGSRLPGDGLTGGLLLLAAAAASALRLRGRVHWRSLVVGGPTAALLLAGASLPFAANRRFGPLGATINDDFALHLEFADILALGEQAERGVDIAYPVGPHSVAACLSDLSGFGIEAAFLGFILALPVIAGLTALAALDHLPERVQPIGGTVVGLGYLSAAFFAQASFKESTIALLVLAGTLLAREVARDRTRGRRWALPAMLLFVAGLGAFSVPAVLWYLAVAGTALLVTMVAERIRPSLRIVAGVGAALAAVAASIVVFELVTSFFSQGPGRFALSASEGSGGDGGRTRGPAAGGNLLGPLSFFEALGVWPHLDFRVEPDTEHWRLGVALAVVATAVGAARSVWRREWVLLAATASAVGIYLVVSEISIAYNAAKALVIAAPLLMLTGVSGLLIPARRPIARVALAVLAASFAVAAANSSLLALRGATVRPDTQAEAFSQLRKAVRGKRTIFLGRENYAAWELRPTQIGYLGAGSRAVTVGYTPQRGAAASRGIDSLTAGELAAAELLVAPNTLYASLPGREFREVLRNRWYRLYRRTRLSPFRHVLDEDSEPGAILDCSTRRGRAALRAGGRAFVRPAPVLGPADDWTFEEGGQPPPGSHIALASNRETMRQTIRLPRGRWEISLSWASSLPISVELGERSLRLPPYIGDGDRHWRVASVRGPRALKVVITPGGERRIDVRRRAEIGPVAAVREDVPGRFLPVERACGRYVDWIQR